MKKDQILWIVLAFGMMANAQEWATITADEVPEGGIEGTGIYVVDSDVSRWDGDCGGYCKSHEEVGNWQDAKEQYVLSIGHDEHQWVYDKKQDSGGFAVYACMCCCATPDYTISQKRVCGLCGWVQEQITFVGHNWVNYPKTKYQIIIDSLKNK